MVESAITQVVSCHPDGGAELDSDWASELLARAKTAKKAPVMIMLARVVVKMEVCLDGAEVQGYVHGCWKTSKKMGIALYFKNGRISEEVNRYLFP